MSQWLCCKLSLYRVNRLIPIQRLLRFIRYIICQDCNYVLSCCNFASQCRDLLWLALTPLHLQIVVGYTKTSATAIFSYPGNCAPLVGRSPPVPTPGDFAGAQKSERIRFQSAISHSWPVFDTIPRRAHPRSRFQILASCQHARVPSFRFMTRPRSVSSGRDGVVHPLPLQAFVRFTTTAISSY